MEFKGFRFDLMKQISAATYKLEVTKFPSLFLNAERDLNGCMTVDKKGDDKLT